MKILHIFKRIDHHSGHSGYDQLTRHMSATHYRPGKIFHFLYRRDPRLFRWNRLIDPEWYSFEYFCVETELMARLNLVNGTTFHFLYGENMYRNIGVVPFRRRNRIVATFHQPPDVFPRAIARPACIARADAIVAVGSSQLDFFRSLTGRDNVYLVPHGIDTEFFTPSGQKDWDGPLRCIVVGWWLRDVDAIRKVIATFGEFRARKVEFHIVAFDWCLKHYEGLRNVHLYSGVPDGQLLELYRKAHLLLMPLNDCTANNAVLESMACGLPVFTSEVGSIRDYVDDSCGRMVRLHDADALVDALIQADENRDLLRRMGDAARAKAEQFSWARVAERMLGLYRRIQ